MPIILLKKIILNNYIGFDIYSKLMIKYFILLRGNYFLQIYLMIQVFNYDNTGKLKGQIKIKC